jgi:hypothetical protein
MERKGEVTMSANGFLESELVTKRVNGQTRVFPVVGGRLRLAHEENETLSLQTELVNWDGQYAVFKCRAVTAKGEFVGYGTANAQRDARLSESLIELSETRSIARALRFAGYGLEFTGAEEVSHVAAAESDGEQNSERTFNKAPERVFPQRNGQGKPEPTNHNGAQVNSAQEAKPKSCGNGRATQAQCRALYALTKRAQYTEQDIESMLRPLSASTFQELSRESASQLISYLQTEVAA